MDTRRWPRFLLSFVWLGARRLAYTLLYTARVTEQCVGRRKDTPFRFRFDLLRATAAPRPRPTRGVPVGRGRLRTGESAQQPRPVRDKRPSGRL